MDTTHRLINIYHIQQVTGNSDSLLATLQCTEIMLLTSDSPVALIAIGGKHQRTSEFKDNDRQQRSKNKMLTFAQQQVIQSELVKLKSHFII